LINKEMKAWNFPRPRAAVITPWGSAGVGVVQVRGAGTKEILQVVFRPARADQAWAAPQIKYGELLDENGEAFDEVLVTCRDCGGFPVAEICCHGGPRPMQKLLLRLKQLGVEQVEPEEAAILPHPTGPAPAIEEELFRALASAPTVCVIETLCAQRQSGGLIDVLTEPEFPASELDLRRLLETWPIAQKMFHPPRLILLGPPNTGKSLLANRLAGRDISIVTDVPGTTRDYVTAPASVAGWPIEIVDTAGLGDAVDLLDAKAQQRTRRETGSAAFGLIVLDASEPFDTRAADFISQLPSIPEFAVVLNKTDLSSAIQPQELPDTLRDKPCYCISARTGEGITALSRGLVHLSGFERLATAGAILFTARQYDLLTAAALHQHDSPIARRFISQCLVGNFSYQ